MISRKNIYEETWQNFAVVLAFTLLFGAIAIVSAAEEKPAVQVGETGYDSLPAAIKAVNATGGEQTTTVKLNADVTLNAAMDISRAQRNIKTLIISPPSKRKV